MDCIFCKIANGEIPSYTIYENEFVKCFLDINPLAIAHTLVVPKKHFVDNSDIDDIYLLKIHEASKIVANIINKKLKPHGIQLVQNNGNIQEVKHYHLHIIPKYKGKTKKISVEDVFNLLTK